MAEGKPRSLPLLPDNPISRGGTPIKNPLPKRKQRLKSQVFLEKNSGNNEERDDFQTKSIDSCSKRGSVVDLKPFSPTEGSLRRNSQEIDPALLDVTRDKKTPASKLLKSKSGETASPVWGSPSTNSSSSHKTIKPYSPQSELMQIGHLSIENNDPFSPNHGGEIALSDRSLESAVEEVSTNSKNEMQPLDNTDRNRGEESKMYSGSDGTQSPANPPKRRQKMRRKKNITDSGTELKSDLGDGIDMTNLEGDISVVSRSGNDTSYPFSFMVSDQKSVSQPVGKCFVEQQGGFLVLDSANSLPPHQPTPAPSFPAAEFAVDVSSRSQKHFHTFSLFCHGLLAGLALWQCIVVYKIGPPNFSAVDFIQHYSALSNPLQTCFYILLVICTVSVFDRYDIGRPHWSFVQGLILCKTGAVTVFIYPITLFLSLSIKDIDDKLGLYYYNATVWETSESKDVDKELEHWKALNLARCIGAILGWIIVSLQPSTSYFQDHLEIIAMDRGKQ